MSQTRFGHIKIPMKRIHLELTNVCEFNCAFCPKEDMTRKYTYLPKEQAFRVLDQVAEHGLAEKVTLHVMGEPTIHPDFFEVLEHAARRGVPIGLTTNGASLGGETGRRLLDYPLHQIDISLQTPTEESFPLRRAGKLTFDDYLTGIFDFFTDYRRRHAETILKLRFLNTTIPQKSIEKRVGPVRVISSKAELRAVFTDWTNRLYDALEVDQAVRERALAKINRLGSLKWNVVEVLPQTFFETYLLADWGNAFYDGKVRPAWAGFCYGMRDHFAILANGDVTLCCIDFNGKTAIGNINRTDLTDILSGPALGKIMAGFRRLKPVHPYCRHCLGSKNLASWLVKPAATLIGLYALKPYFYRQTKLYE